MNRFTKTIAISLALSWAAAAQAEEGASSGWQFTGVFYGWISDLEGDIRAA